MIEAHALTKRYQHSAAVDRLTFTLRPGQVTGFLGPNGAGKSTTMRMIMGLDRPTAGWVHVNGRPFAQIRRPLFEVGAVLDARAVHGGRSARNHLLCLAQSNGIGRRRVDEVLELVGLQAVARRRAGAFSLGMSQRLGIATALLGDPGVLLFDEPINGLDPDGIVWIRTLLRRLAAEGRTVFVSSHLMSEMALTADHVLVIGRGRLVADGSVREIIDRASTKSVRVHTPDGARLSSVLRADGADVGPDDRTYYHAGDTLPEDNAADNAADNGADNGGHDAGVTADHEGGGGSDARLSVSGLDAARIGELAARHHLVLHELTPVHASLEEAFMALTANTVEFGAHAQSNAQPDAGTGAGVTGRRPR